MTDQAAADQPVTGAVEGGDGQAAWAIDPEKITTSTGVADLASFAGGTVSV